MVATSRSSEARSLLRRSEELAAEMARLGEEQRKIARELAALDGATVVLARRRSWPSAVGGALVAVLLALPLLVMIARRQDVVAAPPVAPVVAAIAPVPVEPVIVTPAEPLPVTPEAPRVAALAPPPAATGGLTVVCMPRCTRIVDNGVNLGPGHIFNRPTAIGVHQLRLEADGVVKTATAEVRRGETTDVRVSVSEDAPSLRD